MFNTLLTPVITTAIKSYHILIHFNWTDWRVKWRKRSKWKNELDHWVSARFYPPTKKKKNNKKKAHVVNGGHKTLASIVSILAIFCINCLCVCVFMCWCVYVCADSGRQCCPGSGAPIDREVRNEKRNSKKKKKLNIQNQKLTEPGDKLDGLHYWPYP